MKGRKEDGLKVLVTDAKSRIGYNVVKSLGSRGIPVFTVDFIRRPMASVSRFCDGHSVCPSPFSDPDGFLTAVTQVIDRRHIDVLIPVFEETFLIAKYRERLEGRVRLVLSDYRKILAAHNKDQWALLAHELGIPVPATYDVLAVQSGGVNPTDLHFPVLVKPKQGGGAWGIRQVDSPENLAALLEWPDYENKPWDRFFIQEKILGNTVCVAMLMNRGELRARIGYKQLRDYPVSGGQATLRESIRNERTESYLQAILEKVGWHGVCQADFIIENGTGTPYLIDLNPRLWGSIVQATACGIDFPYLLYRIAADGDVDPALDFPEGVRTRWIGGDTRALFSLLRESNQKTRLLKQFFFPRQPAAQLDDFTFSDPLPFLSWCFHAVLKSMRTRSTRPVSHDQLDGIWE